MAKINIISNSFRKNSKINISSYDRRKLKKIKRKGYIIQCICGCCTTEHNMYIYFNVPDGTYFVTDKKIKKAFITELSLIFNVSDLIMLFIAFKNKNEYLKWKLKNE